MQIFNTLTRQKEEFVPQVPGEYRIYVCGPEKILNRQKSFCGIWLASDGRYKTKVPTADGGKKLIAKPTTGEPNEDGTITICQEETKTYHKDDDLFFWIKPEKEFMTMLSTMLSAD